MAGPERALFLSYRRADTGGYAGRLADALEARFGEGSVFHDVETILPGTDFAAAIEAAIASASVVLVLIGDDWLDARDAAGHRLLDRQDDFVRLEAASALASGKAVLPLLVEGARMPAAADLPTDLQRLARQQALELSDSRWAHDVDRLVDAIRRCGGIAPARAPAPASAAAPAVPRRARRFAAAGPGAAVVVGGALFVGSRRPPDLAGRWDLPTGSFWTVSQEGPNLIIEETHYLSREVWKRGTGRIKGSTIRVSLDWVFERLPPQTGTFRLSEDGRTLVGGLGVPDREPGKTRVAPTVLVRR
ncbi:MAG: toll/interleukin-1 receptor domain-containing protein [Betaproteobacteria bacterium]|jgi:hypothetical protein|nr:toll/interleukin-1 receptor domain-containing protein [Betaproteobacteria bacterium]